MTSGWVSIHRRLWDNPISKRKGWLIIWITIISMANHESNNFVWNGETITIKRGQWLTGRKVISDITKESEQTVRGALNYFESNQMIHRKVTNKFTIITVLNYSKYQNIKSNLTNKQPTTNQQITTNNNDNKNNIYVDQIANILLGHFNKVMDRNCTNTKSFTSNLAYWLTIYSKEQIAKAISRMPSHQFFSKIETPVTLFRRKNQNREDVDYIGQLLNSKPQKKSTSFNDLIK